MIPRTTTLSAFAIGAAIAAYAAEPLTLTTALQEAMSQGASTKIESEKIVKAREFENEKRGMLWPTVAAYANAGRGAQPISNTMKAMGPALGIPDSTVAGMDDYMNVTGNQFDYGVQVSGPIYTFGKVTTAIEAAEKQNVAVSAGVRRSKQEIQSNVVDAYANTLLAEQRIDVLRRSRERALETYAITERDFNGGKGMKSDLLLAKASIKQLEPDILAAENAALLARQNLNRLLGRPAGDKSALDTNLTINGLSDQIPARDAAVEQAKRERPDLIAVQTSARVYEVTSEIFKANYYPTIAYQGKFGFTGSEPEHLVEWVHRTWTIGVGVNWTLFDGFASQGSNRAQVAQWKSDARVYQYQAQELERAIEMGIDEALGNVANADSSLQAAMEGRDAATEAVAFLKANYPGANLRLADVMQGEEALRNAEFAVLAARVKRTTALAQLQIAMGKDLVSVPEE